MSRINGATAAAALKEAKLAIRERYHDDLGGPAFVAVGVGW
jgi:hypothetical protein